MEINLSLDEHGRTSFIPPSCGSDDSNTNVSQGQTSGMSYETNAVIFENLAALSNQCSRVVDTSTKCNISGKQEPSQHEIDYDSLLLDCEVADCALLPRTFWLDPETKPRCLLEQLAKEIFLHHVDIDSNTYDKSRSGAEWWVQIRPSPPAGRYAVLDNDPSTKNSISFHWDKDEELRLLTSGSLYIHPHLSTVTYLTDFGVPTISLPCLMDSSSGGNAEFKFASDSTNVQRGNISWPRAGKHFKFDGRLLHAAPTELVPSDLLQKQLNSCDLPCNPSVDQKIAVRRRRRVTFLVNIWLNHKPIGVEPFPDAMLDKLTPPNIHNFTSNCKEDDMAMIDVAKLYAETQQEISDKNSDHVHEEGNNVSLAPKVKSFKWTLGSSVAKDDAIVAKIPLRFIQENIGQTIEMKWNDDGVALQHIPPQTNYVTSTKSQEQEPKSLSGMEDETLLASTKKRKNSDVGNKEETAT